MNIRVENKMCINVFQSTSITTTIVWLRRITSIRCISFALDENIVFPEFSRTQDNYGIIERWKRKPRG